MFLDKGIKFLVVSGSYDERFNKARELVENLFEKKN
jgi:nicotinamide riboside kinase